MSEKKQTQINIVLESMKDGKWYKAGELVEVLGLKETRTKEILRLMVGFGMLETDKETKGKSYKEIIK